MAGAVVTAVVAAVISLHPVKAPTSTNELLCAAGAGYWEGRSKSTEARVGILHVVRNRMADDEDYASTACGVIKEPAQFSWVRKPQKDQKLDREAWDETVRLADAVARGQIPDPTHGATNFCRLEELNSKNARLRKAVAWCRNSKALAWIDGFKFVNPKLAKLGPLLKARPQRKPDVEMAEIP